jgi:hypothetical protein
MSNGYAMGSKKVKYVTLKKIFGRLADDLGGISAGVFYKV